MGERCKTCKHDSKPWYEEPCDSCCGAHSGYEPINLQPTCNKLATDCISRQAAIDALEKELSAKYNNIALAVGFIGAKSIIENVPSAQPDNDMIHLQKEQAYLQGWEEGREALREEMWEDGRDRLD